MSMEKTWKPVVYAVGKQYQIMVPAAEEVTMWVRVGKEEYFDHSNGVLRSAVLVHKMTVPMEELNKARSYTICTRKVLERKSYFSVTEDVKEESFEFQPVEGKEIRAYHLSDIHNRTKEALTAARTFGKIDFLIMNGDIAGDSGTIENARYVHEIAAEVSGGKIPVIFSRGNHDMRGIYGDRLHENMPCENGKPYYTFRLGNIWGLVLDCGEDKPDDHAEYGNTLCCRVFREEETRYLRELVKHPEQEYNAEGVKKRLVIVHYPFTYRMEPPFYMDKEVYTEWISLLKDYIKPDLMLAGHMHNLQINYPGCENDHLGQPCPVIVASALKDQYFIGTGLELKEKEIVLTFTDSKEEVIKKEIIKIED